MATSKDVTRFKGTHSLTHAEFARLLFAFAQHNNLPNWKNTHSADQSLRNFEKRGSMNQDLNATLDKFLKIMPDNGNSVSSREVKDKLPRIPEVGGLPELLSDLDALKLKMDQARFAYLDALQAKLALLDEQASIVEDEIKRYS